MSKLFFVSMLAATSIVTAHGQESVLDNVERLPQIFNHKLVVNYGPQFAAVQPTAFVKFDFASCRKFTFSAEVITEVIGESNVNFVKITYPRNQAECRGMPIKRTYDVQVSSDYSAGAKQFVILNPIGQDLPAHD